jgi:hypothetical protein
MRESVCSVCVPSQERWIAEARPAAKLTLTCGQAAIKLFQDMERGGPVTASTFRPVESLVVPGDMKSLVEQLNPELGKPTASRLKAIVYELADNRWWLWAICHPEHPESVIHPTRSVHAPSFHAFPPWHWC